MKASFMQMKLLRGSCPKGSFLHKAHYHRCDVKQSSIPSRTTREVESLMFKSNMQQTQTGKGQLFCCIGLLCVACAYPGLHGLLHD